MIYLVHLSAVWRIVRKTEALEEPFPRPSEDTPKGGTQVLPVCATPAQLDYFVALALQQHGEQSALRKGQVRFCQNVVFFVFHKRFLVEVDCSKPAWNEEPSLRGAFNSGLLSADSGLQLNLEIALSGVSAKVKPFNRFFRPAENASRRRMT
jgi:hypothetical protein